MSPCARRSGRDRWEERRFVGIDISKAHLTWLGGEDTVARSANDTLSCAAVAAELKDATLVVVEATGGYELEKIVRALQAAQAPVAVVNRRRVRGFRPGVGSVGEDGPVGMLVIADSARAMRPSENRQIEDGRMALAKSVARRRQLIDMLVAGSRTHRARRSLDGGGVSRDHLAYPGTQLTSTSTPPSPFRRAPTRPSPVAATSSSVPGIGGTTAAALLAEPPELGAIDDKKTAALVGVAPVAHDKRDAARPAPYRRGTLERPMPPRYGDSQRLRRTD